MSQVERICLAGLCGKWAVYLYSALTPVILAVGPTIHQRRLTVWSMKVGYVMALGQFLLG